MARACWYCWQLSPIYWYQVKEIYRQGIDKNTVFVSPFYYYYFLNGGGRVGGGGDVYFVDHCINLNEF